jgi:heterodisulfide reductase subunit C
MTSPEQLEDGTGAEHHAPASLQDEIGALTGANPARCYQCGKCSAGCPMAVETSLRPHDILRLINLDKRDKLMENDSIWLCLTCETCAARCPNSCDPARVIDTLREMSLASGSTAAPKAISAFHSAFLNQIKFGGRLFEVGLIANYKFTGGALLADVMTAPGMFMRGKLSLKPRRIKGVKDVRRIFAACEAAAKEQQ